MSTQQEFLAAIALRNAHEDALAEDCARQELWLEEGLKWDALTVQGQFWWEREGREVLENQRRYSHV